MFDIENCQECNMEHHIDDGAECMACSMHFCMYCAVEQGFWFSDIFGGEIYVCLVCIAEYKENGMDWLRGELCEEFEEAVFLEALKEFESEEILEDNTEESESGFFEQEGSFCELNLDLQRGQRLAPQYASKYICDRTNRDVAKITDNDLRDVFNGCVIPAKVEWYPFIREEISKIIVEAKGMPIGAEIQ